MMNYDWFINTDCSLQAITKSNIKSELCSAWICVQRAQTFVRERTSDGMKTIFQNFVLPTSSEFDFVKKKSSELDVVKKFRI